MVAPILLYTNCCCGQLPKPLGGERCGTGDKIGVAAMIFDIVLAIFCVSIATLMLLTTHGCRPITAAYAMLSVTCVISILWTAALFQIVADRENVIANVLRH